jgi:hypothetical protein
MDLFEQIRGMADCRENRPIDPNANASYLSGYRMEYELQEINSNNYRQGEVNGADNQKASQNSVNA